MRLPVHQDVFGTSDFEHDVGLSVERPTDPRRDERVGDILALSFPLRVRRDDLLGVRTRQTEEAGRLVDLAHGKRHRRRLRPHHRREVDDEQVRHDEAGDDEKSTHLALHAREEAVDRQSLHWCSLIKEFVAQHCFADGVVTPSDDDGFGDVYPSRLDEGLVAR